MECNHNSEGEYPSILHGDHLLSTATTSNGAGTVTGNIQYTAYGRYRGGSEMLTENRFTGQKLDGSGRSGLVRGTC